MVPASMPASTVILRPSGSEDETVEMQDRGLVGRAIVVSFLSCRFQHGSRKAIRIGVCVEHVTAGSEPCIEFCRKLKVKRRGMPFKDCDRYRRIAAITIGGGNRSECSPQSCETRR